MLTSLDKLTSGGNDIIQIEITRRCSLFHCSNCTRLLPFRHDALDMSLDVFREAVRSLKDWPGICALFGGNPTCHPQFPEICAIMREEIPDQRHRGIWLNDLMQHGQVVRDTFYPHGRFNCNVHADEAAAVEIDKWLPGKLIQSSRSRASWHSPILVDRKDVGVSDEAWPAMREACDINRRWSAIVMEVGGEPHAFFCEVAGSISAIRGEKNGIRVEPGWWRWKMDRFDNQVRQCCDRGCGVPLKGLGHLDRDDTYDVSPSWVPLTIERKPKVKAVIHETMPPQTEQPTDYQTRWTKKPQPV